MRIFLAEKSKDLRVGLQFLLHQEPGLQVIGVADSGKGLPTRIKASQPDVLLLDWYLPDAHMTELIADIRALDFQLQIIVISVHPQEKSAVMSAGADYFIVKNSPPDKLLAKLRDYSQIPTDVTPFASTKKQT